MNAPSRLKPPGWQNKRIFPQPNLAGPSARQAELIAAIGSLHDVLGDMSGLLARLTPAVLAQKTIQLDGNGQASEQFRVPYAAVSVDYFGTALLTVAAHPLQQAAPGPGVGIAKVGPGGFAVVNFKANVLSFYGNPGDFVTFAAMASPQPPNGVLNGAGGALVIPASFYPAGAVPISASSGNVAASPAVATLAGVAGKTTWITGFELTAAGATAGAAVVATVAGPAVTLSYIFTAPTGAAVGALPLSVEFAEPIPAAAANTAIVVTLPSLGAGNTNAAAVAHGFQL